MNAPIAPPPAIDLDAQALDAALWRAYRRLSGHWLHALRGSLNGLSLNIQLLTAGKAAASNERASTAARTLVRELDTALTRFLDQSAPDDRQEPCCDVGTTVAGVRSLVEPLARHHHVTVELCGSATGPMAAVDGQSLHAVLLPTIVDVLCSSGAPSVLSLLVEDDPSGAIRIDVRPGPDCAGVAIDEAFRDAARRLLRFRGGDLRDVPDRAAGLTLLLQRSSSSAT